MNPNTTISRRERLAAAANYLLFFINGDMLLHYLEMLSKNTEFMSFHHKESLRLGKFSLVGLLLLALIVGIWFLLDFSKTVFLIGGIFLALYCLIDIFFIFKGVYYAFRGQTKKVF
jgi:hypothetical protein